VAEKASMAQADAILIYAHFRDDYIGKASPSLFHAPINATRLSYFRKTRTGFVEAWRQTSVQYATLFPVLFPTQAGNFVGFLRDAKKAGDPAGEPDITAFLKNTLAMNLTLSQIDIAADRDATLEAALSKPDGFDAAKQTLVDDVFESFGSYDKKVTPDSIQLAFALLGDPRVNVPRTVGT